jgi:hypothetical protein
VAQGRPVPRVLVLTRLAAGNNPRLVRALAFLPVRRYPGGYNHYRASEATCCTESSERDGDEPIMVREMFVAKLFLAPRGGK